jgi:hypothetical protein
MKKQTTHPVQARLLRGAFYLLLLLPVCVCPFAVAQRNATKPKRGQVRQREQRIGERRHALPANTIVVTNTNDSGPGSLRQALADANDGDTIDATGVSGTILLTSGELQINHNVTINGPGAGNLAVNGNANSRVFENFASAVTIAGLTITNGHPPLPDNSGGGILNHGGLTLSESSVSNSVAQGLNGGSGGGIFVDVGGTLTVTNSTISGNGACCVSAYGGGIYSAGTLEVSNSTISGNGADFTGGGIATIWQVTVRNSTISGNSAPAGSISVLGGQMTIGDTILKAGEMGVTISTHFGTVTSLGYNLASDNAFGLLTGPGDQINTDPMSGPLQDNGGPTFTHALLPGSPAIDAGDPGFVPPPFYDQRGPGFDRVFNGRIDIGSFELQSTPTATATPTPTSSPTATPTPTPTPTPTATTTPTPTPTPTPTVTVTPTPTATPRATPRPRPTPHPRPTP